MSDAVPGQLLMMDRPVRQREPWAMSADARAVRLAPSVGVTEGTGPSPVKRDVRLNLLDLGHHSDEFLSGLLGPSHRWPPVSSQPVLLLPRTVMLRYVNLCAHAGPGWVANSTNEQSPSWLSTIVHFLDSDDDIASVAPIARRGPTNAPDHVSAPFGVRRYFVGSEEGDEFDELFHLGSHIFSQREERSDEQSYSPLRSTSFDDALASMFDHPNYPKDSWDPLESSSVDGAFRPEADETPATMLLQPLVSPSLSSTLRSAMTQLLPRALQLPVQAVTLIQAPLARLVRQVPVAARNVPVPAVDVARIEEDLPAPIGSSLGDLMRVLAEGSMLKSLDPGEKS